MFETELPLSIVAFADALGTTASVRPPDTAIDFLSRLQAATSQMGPRISRLDRLQGVRLRWFSDSFAMSVPLQDSGNLLSLLNNMAFVQATFALHGIFLRGGIARGGHYHDQFIDYGPALVEAVELQSRAGDSVRIILSDDLRYDVEQVARISNETSVCQDLSDGRCFLDFIGRLQPPAWKGLRTQLELRHPMAIGDKKTLRKLEWLAAYFNWRVGTDKPINFAAKQEFRLLEKGLV